MASRVSATPTHRQDIRNGLGMAATKNHISAVEYKSLHFLITDRPSDTSLDNYISVCDIACDCYC
jgi:hypothetical protein